MEHATLPPHLALKPLHKAPARIGRIQRVVHHVAVAVAALAIVRQLDERVGTHEACCHGRSETETMARDFLHLPLKVVPYRDRTLQEFDLDAALVWASQQPAPRGCCSRKRHTAMPRVRATPSAGRTWRSHRPTAYLPIARKTPRGAAVCCASATAYLNERAGLTGRKPQRHFMHRHALRCVGTFRYPGLGGCCARGHENHHTGGRKRHSENVRAFG